MEATETTIAPPWAKYLDEPSQFGDSDSAPAPKPAAKPADAAKKGAAANPSSNSDGDEHPGDPNAPSNPGGSSAPPLAVAPTPIEANDDPHRLARMIHRLQCERKRPLAYWRQQWFRWNGKSYRQAHTDEARAIIYREVKAEFDRINLVQVAACKDGTGDKIPYAEKVTTALARNVLETLATLCALHPELEFNEWIGDDGLGQKRQLISLNNGLLGVVEILAADDNTPLESVLFEHSPQWFSLSHLPYDFDPHAKSERWLRFVNWAMEDDEERVDLVQEWAGYLLTPDTSQQKFMVLEGDGANGKSVFCAAMEAMLGPENVSHVPLERFGDKFALYGTAGKLANIIGDVGELEKTEEGFLKSFTSGDRMSFDRKHLTQVDIKPTARLMLSANNRPRFSDRSSGIWRRMIVVPFRATIEENRKVRGMDHAKFWLESGDLPGILNWALIGLHRLRGQGKFTEPAVCAAALAEYRLDANPAAAFLSEHYALADNPGAYVSSDDIYAHYKRWCVEKQHHPITDRNFGKEIKRAFRTTERVRRGGKGNQFYVHLGIKPANDF